MHKYRLVAKKGEGTFSEVLKAQCIKNSKYVAIKCMKNHFDSLDQVNNLREIQALRRLSPHPNIIKLLEVLYDQPTGRLALVFELMDMNIYELIRGRRHYVAEDRVKMYMYQLMKAMDHMHRNGIFHRDIKPENILIMDDCLKLADFGSCRGIYSKQPYTEYISTRWYRAPECLLTDGYYNYKMDMWGVGCVFFEVVSLFPLFPGNNELDQIQKIHNIMGTPPAELLAKMKKRSAHMSFDFPAKEGSGVAKLIPHVNPDCSDLIAKLLAYNPDERLSARQALKHPYFKELREAEKRQKSMLTPADVASHGLYLDEQKRQHSMSEAEASKLHIDNGGSETSRSHAQSECGNLPSITGNTLKAFHSSIPPVPAHGGHPKNDMLTKADQEGLISAESSMMSYHPSIANNLPHQGSFVSIAAETSINDGMLPPLVAKGSNVQAGVHRKPMPPCNNPQHSLGSLTQHQHQTTSYSNLGYAGGGLVGNTSMNGGIGMVNGASNAGRQGAQQQRMPIPKYTKQSANSTVPAPTHTSSVKYKTSASQKASGRGGAYVSPYSQRAFRDQ